MKRAVVLQHTPTEGPERVGELLAERGYELDVRHLYRPAGAGAADTALPAAASLAPGEPLVVMGGPMGVGDAGDPRWPFLGPEIDLLRALLGRDHPVLGICLGSQLLAAAAGARVYPNTRDGQPLREVGWAPVDLIGAGGDPVLAGLGARETFLHWHGDTFDLPAGAVHLASTPACKHQAFRLGRRAFGLQFHPELGPGVIATWVRDDADYVRAANGDGGGARILEDTARLFAGARPVWDRLLRNVLDSMLKD